MSRLFYLASGLSVGAIALNSFLFNVDGGQRALIYNLNGGIEDRIIGEGTHFYMPVLQRPIIYDIRIAPRTIKTETGTKDLQTVAISLRVLHSPNIAKLPKIHKDLGEDYIAKVLPSIGNEVLKSIVAHYDAGELITQREQVSHAVTTALKARAKEFSIELADVSITHVGFSADYMRAVEEKQVAQQRAETQKFIVQRVSQEKEADVILASGESEAAKLIMEGMQSGNEFITLRKIEAARNIARVLSRSPNVTYLPGGENILLNLNRE